MKFLVSDFIGRFSFLVPVWNAERSGPGVGIQSSRAERLPLSVFLDVQLNILVVFFAQRTRERAQLHHEPIVGT